MSHSDTMRFHGVPLAVVVITNVSCREARCGAVPYTHTHTHKRYIQCTHAVTHVHVHTHMHAHSHSCRSIHIHTHSYRLTRFILSHTHTHTHTHTQFACKYTDSPKACNEHFPSFLTSTTHFTTELQVSSILTFTN